jgi:hypothetical protein
MSQLCVWPFPLTTIVILGEQSRNPDHHFAGVYKRIVFKPKKHYYSVFLTWARILLQEKGCYDRL